MGGKIAGFIGLNNNCFFYNDRNTLLLQVFYFIAINLL